MVNKSTHYDGENVSLYRIDWSETDRTPVQQRFKGVSVSPVRQDHLEEYAELVGENKVYLFVTHTPVHPEEQEYEGAVPFDEVRETLGTPYKDVSDEDVYLLGAEDVGTDDLPEDLYAELVDIVDARGYAVNELASVYREPVEQGAEEELLQAR